MTGLNQFCNNMNTSALSEKNKLPEEYRHECFLRDCKLRFFFYSILFVGGFILALMLDIGI